MRNLIQKLMDNRYLYLVYQLSKPLLALFFLVGVFYLDQSLNELGCRFVYNQSAAFKSSSLPGAGLK